MIKKIVETIEKFLSTNDLPDVRRNVDDILNGIELLNKDREIPKVHNIINESKTIIKYHMDQILEIPLTTEYTTFVTCLTKLLYNFNLNTVNDADLSLFCRFLNKTIELTEFSKIVIEIEKKANIVIQQWKNFNPPSLSISKALLEEVLQD